MLLSDRLIAAGLNANPKSNLSMSIAETEIVIKCKYASLLTTQKQMENIIQFACDLLHSKGYKYYNAKRILASAQQ